MKPARGKVTFTRTDAPDASFTRELDENGRVGGDPVPGAPDLVFEGTFAYELDDTKFHDTP